MNRSRDSLWRTAKRRLRPPVERLLASGGCIAGVQTDEPIVALTFDDGPDPQWTTPILEVLSQFNAKATFFVLCGNAERNPALVRRIRDEGHEIGLHGLDHTSLNVLPARSVLRRTREGRQCLETLLDQPVRWFRPPYGDQRIRNYAMVRAVGLDVVMWSAVGDDWLQQPVERAADLIVPALHPGSVVLLHDGWEPPMSRPAVRPTFDRGRMVEILLERMAMLGLRATSVGELLRGRDPVRSVATIL